MSVIVAVKHGGIVYMGADTQLTYESGERKNSTIESERKIYKFANGLLMGAVGRADTIMRLVYAKDIFTVPSEGLSKRHIVTEIVPKMFEFLDKRKLVVEPDEDDDDERCYMRCSFLLAHKDKLFYISRYFGVWENARYCIAGSGSPYAFAHFNSFDYNGDINGQLVAAMRNCAKHDNSVSAPFMLIDSKNLEYAVRE